LRALRGMAGPGVTLAPAVKANAYGHGVDIVAPAIAGEPGVVMLAVANVTEALELRAMGIRNRVLILSACLREEVADIIRGRFEAMVSGLEEVDWFEREAQRLGRPAHVHLKIDTGMGRLGIWHEEAMTLFERVRDAKMLRVAGVCTHFARADDCAAFTKRQWRRFQKVRDLARSLWPKMTFHAANSGALLKYRDAHCDIARPGIALYGSWPEPRFAGKLQPVMTWKARVTMVREVARGRTLSYGATFTTKRAMRIGVVAVGYADGYARAWSNRGAMLIRGHRCPVVGRVTMDQTLVDLTRAVAVRPGDEAVLLGRGLSAEDLAKGLGTISYEIFTGVGPRVKRLAVGA